MVSRPDSAPQFRVELEAFSGPFDLLLQLISAHKLDVTQVALAQVCDDFIAHIRAAEAAGQWDLDQASSFVVIAATLLDLKAARLLPAGDVDEDEDLEALGARDLLFARLLQYRAFKAASVWLRERWEIGALSIPRRAPLDPEVAAMLPQLVITFGPERLAQAMEHIYDRRVAASRGVVTDHIHDPAVSIAEQTRLVAERLQRSGRAAFSDMIFDADRPMVVAARFLGVLELYRESYIAMDQQAPFAELTLEWSPRNDVVDLSALDVTVWDEGEPNRADGADAT